MDPVFHSPPSLDRSTIDSPRNQKQGRSRATDLEGSGIGHARHAVCSVACTREATSHGSCPGGSGGVAVVTHRGPGSGYAAGKDGEWTAL